MILIAFGSNLPSRAGPPAATLRAALAAIESTGIEAVRVSRLYRTEAWPNPGDPAFVNAVAQVITALPPRALLKTLHAIERSFGRVRTISNAPRTLDLDILDYEGCIESGPPTLPHPRLDRRSFVLVPLAEIAPEWRHPVCGLAAEDLLAKLPDGLRQVVPLPSRDLAG